jgi:hypothetical protein
VGLTDIVDETSFSDAEEETNHFLGFVVPESFSETKTRTAREIINLVNQSVFGSLFQNESFELSYSVLSPEKPETMLQLTENDLLGMSVQSDNSNIAKTVILRYGKKEYDPESQAAQISEVEVTSDTAEFLAKSEKEVVVDTVLRNAADASAFAYRRAFILEAATSIIKIKLALQGSATNINDKVGISHPQLYERVGSAVKWKIGGVSQASKDLFGSSLELDDLSNAFSKCATIADDETSDYDEASDEELTVSGFITDDYGMIDNDADTFGINLIW